jgi:hypothetical protein
LASELQLQRAQADTLRASASARDAEEMYLRNVVKKYMETEQHEALFPVIATCMHFSQAEIDEIRTLTPTPTPNPLPLPLTPYPTPSPIPYPYP